MNYLNLSGEFLKDAEQYCTYDPDISFPFRVLAKLLMESRFTDAIRLMDANPDAFTGTYSWMPLDSAVEMCLNQVQEEDGVYRPVQDAVHFIAYLLEHGADPKLPAHFHQLEHLADVERDCSEQIGVRYDCSEVKELLERYW
ncbi:MAG: hypothetical protein IJN57_05900 [Oscillospiraceae bacterium]|nr:hypothetical protein [Oscillospiraceae bacterium]